MKINDKPVTKRPPPPGATPMTEDQINHMINRFLSWKLPSDFCPDNGISFEPIGNKGTRWEYRREPVGTNLFTASQAKSMILHLIAGEDQTNDRS